MNQRAVCRIAEINACMARGNLSPASITRHKTARRDYTHLLQSGGFYDSRTECYCGEADIRMSACRFCEAPRVTPLCSCGVDTAESEAHRKAVPQLIKEGRITFAGKKNPPTVLWQGIDPDDVYTWGEHANPMDAAAAMETKKKEWEPPCGRGNSGHYEGSCECFGYSP